MTKGGKGNTATLRVTKPLEAELVGADAGWTHAPTRVSAPPAPGGSPATDPGFSPVTDLGDLLATDPGDSPTSDPGTHRPLTLGLASH